MANNDRTPEGDLVKCLECGHTVPISGAYELTTGSDKGKYLCRKTCLGIYLENEPMQPKPTALLPAYAGS
jgi:hypothetical protein